MSMFNRLAGGSALAVLAAALVAPVAVVAQETTAVVRGEITGAGAALSGATVVVTHVPSGTRSTARTNAAGQFIASGLRVGGPYTVDVAASNFRSATVSDLFVLAGEPFTLALDLEAATREVQTVVVTGQRVGTAAADGASTTNLRRDAIVGVVAINRDIRELARRSALASQNSRGDGGISIAGSNPRTNRITIDGTASQDDFGLNTGGLPTRRGPVSIDAVQQFSISATPYDARNGGFLGGAIDVVLRAGDNNFGGSAFVNFIDDGLTGDRVAGVRISNQVEQTNWGATLRGPILKDRLFFALSYETYESVDGTSTGPAGLGFANTIAGPNGPMTLADISAVTNVFTNVYRSDFAFGSIPATKPITDEKITARFDWNITDDHRAQFTYRKSESGLIQRTNIGQFSAGLDSQWYLTGEADETYSLQLNSNWTDALSTELRLSHRDYERLQDPPSGQEFSDIRVCASATSFDTGGQQPLLNCRASNNSTGIGVVRWGPDQFRHANYLNTKNTQGQFEARYLLGDHTIKAGLQHQFRDVFNLFVPSSDGVYYFDSIADFAAGRANQFQYTNSPSGDANNAAAEFTYSITSLYAQDTWRLSDTLRVTGGLRFDAYASDDKPVANANFQGRHGFSNQTTYDGLNIIMPRFSFNWRPMDTVKLTGGFGLFSGGLPDVFISNSFSNTGIATVGIDIIREANGTFTERNGSPGFTQDLGALALNNLVGSGFGRSVPAQIVALLGGVVPNPGAETNSIDPKFDVPADWKANLNAEIDLPKGFALGMDAVYTRVGTGLAFRDIRAVPLVVNGQQARTPDGRIRYDALSSAQRTSIMGTTVNSSAPAGGASRDIQAYNPNGDLGQAWILAASLSKEWFEGFNTSIAYTFQNVDELSNAARFSSTASSLYGGQFTSLDPNAPASGIGQEEIRNAIKYSVDWRATPFGDLETRLSLFGDQRSGRPFSWTMSGGSGRNTVFGVNKGGQLAYVPDLSGASSATVSGGTVLIPSDTRVSFDSLDTLNRLIGVVDRFGLPQGGIIPRGTNRNSDVHLVDLKLSQQLPALRSGDRAYVTFELGNLLNALNDDWGVIEEFGEEQTLFNVACADAAGVANNAGAVTCNRYRISGVSDIVASNRLPTRNTDRSRWQVQVGLRYEF